MSIKEAKKYPIKMDSPESVISLINNTESGIYGTENEDGERVGVCVSKGVGMDVYTYQKNGWIRMDSYDLTGFKTLETFKGRYTK